jgi:spermidine/putrescine transport system ATP-binding protein
MSAEPIIYGLIFIGVLVLVEGLYLVAFGKSISLNSRVNRRLEMLEKGARREEGLDKLRKEMQIELQDLQRQLGITFILVTHDQEEALSLSDRICVMRAGQIVQVGTPQELYDRPQTRYVAGFVGTSNFFDGRVTSVDGDMAKIEMSDGQTFKAMSSGTVGVGEQGCVCVRPEQLRMNRVQSSGALEVTIQNRIFLGEHTEYVVRHTTLGSITVLAPRQSDDGLAALGKGDVAYIHWNPEAALILRND